MPAPPSPQVKAQNQANIAAAKGKSGAAPGSPSRFNGGSTGRPPGAGGPGAVNAAAANAANMLRAGNLGSPNNAGGVYNNPAVFTPGKDQSRVPQAPAPRVTRVQGGRGIQPYARLSQAAPPPKIQDRLPSGGVAVAMDPSLMGRVTGRPSPAASMPAENYSDGVTRDGTGPSIYGGEGVRDNLVSRIASRITSPLVKAGFSLKQAKAPDPMSFGSMFTRSMREGGGDPLLWRRRGQGQSSNVGLV
jgi:hypothetical protein